MNLFLQKEKQKIGFKSILCLVVLMLISESCTVFKRKKTKQENDQVTRLISIARTYTGVPYLSGGVNYNGVDCSGLLYSSFESIGIRIPRISYQQSEHFKQVDLSEIKPGDMVFFVTTNKGEASRISHSGLVTEVRGAQEVMFIHASSSKGVREDNLYSKYWKASFAKAIRAFE